MFSLIFANLKSYLDGVLNWSQQDCPRSSVCVPFMDENKEIFEPDAKKHFIISGVGFWISFCNICDHCSWNDDKTGFYSGTHWFLNISVVLSIIRG